MMKMTALANEIIKKKILSNHNSMSTFTGKIKENQTNPVNMCTLF